jgi:probable HAF family extracellular repeat protein
MGPVVRIERPPVDKSQIGFMYQRGALQGVSRTLAPQMMSSDIAEFSVDQRDQPFKGLLVSGLPAYEQFGNRMEMWLIHSQLRPKQSYAKIALRSTQVNANGQANLTASQSGKVFTHFQKICEPISPSVSAALSDGQRPRAAVPGTGAAPKSIQSEARNWEIGMKKEVTLVVLALSVVLGALQAPAQTPVYHVNLLGISDGRTGVQVEYPSGLNRWGQIIGTYGGGLSGGTHAVLWSPNVANDGFSAGTLFPIESSPGLPAGTANTGPTGLNDRGQVAGWAFTPGKGDGNQTQSWMWRPTILNGPTGVLHGNKGSAVTFPLVSIPGFGTLAEYNQSINNLGVIAAGGISYRALLWTPSTPNGKSGTWTYDPNHAAAPSGINDAGQVSGSSCESSTWNGPYLHSGAFPPLLDSDVISSPLWIPPSSPECVTAGGIALNSEGHLAVSAVSTANSIRAYLYRNGAAKDISTGLASHAQGINAYDQVVGYADTDTRRAYLFQRGAAVDLNTLNDSTNGLLLKYALAINNAGQILATGVYPGAGATLLLTPNALVINPVNVIKGQMQISGTTYKQNVRVQNLGATAITGPISVALNGLTQGVTLTNKTGKTVYTGPGVVYANVSASDLPAGATTVAFTLVFSNPQLKVINYTPRVLGSAAPR